MSFYKVFEPGLSLNSFFAQPFAFVGQQFEFELLSKSKYELVEGLDGFFPQMLIMAAFLSDGLKMGFFVAGPLMLTKAWFHGSFMS